MTVMQANTKKQHWENIYQTKDIIREVDWYQSGLKKCSGLNVIQYSEESIKKIFGGNFDHIKSFERVHSTPFNTEQSFLWSVFKRSTVS